MIGRTLEERLVTKAKSGDGRSLRRLVLAHESYIKKEVLRLRKKTMMSSRLFNNRDLMQVGFESFVENFGKFDPSRGYRVWGYLQHPVRSSLDKTVDKTRRDEVIPLIESFTYGLEALEDKLVRENEDLSGIASVEDLSEHARWALDGIPNATSLTTDYYSRHNRMWTNRILREPEGMRLLFYIPGNENVEEEIIFGQEEPALKVLLDRLPERQRYVLKKRYGVGYDGVSTLSELSEELGISRERVRQIQREGEETLKKRLASHDTAGCNKLAA